MPEEKFDVVILGTGAAGEFAAHRLAARGKRVAVVERERIEGECGYWACNPSKTLLRPTYLHGESEKCFGTGEVRLDWPEISAYRDEMVRHYDDSVLADRLVDKGVVVVREDGHLDGPGRVQAGSRTLCAPDIVIATGSEPIIPPISGLAESGYWTNREVVSLTEIPRSLVFIGGGPVAVELGQMMRRYGSQVTIVERFERLMLAEEPELGPLLEEALRADGIDLRLGVEVETVSRVDGETRVGLSDGSAATADHVVVAVGRRPRTAGIGIETVGLQVEAGRGIAVDSYGRAGQGLWAIGDVTGPPFFTHRSIYHARCIAATIAGLDRPIDERALPRVTFTDPEIAAVGATEEAARRSGIDAVAASFPFTELDRPYTYQKDWSGIGKIVVERSTGVVLGAAAAGPLSSEYIHVASLAIKARLSYTELRDLMFQFPTFAELYWHLGEELDAIIGDSPV
ncbi:MAG: NAD(P)/FAD-dependent oxidoreductase [Coriobacteriales bacterium]|nr:NAD(P)/FAD-dependent oxidoreductase [Coriobacteriales bacterium]